MRPTSEIIERLNVLSSRIPGLEEAYQKQAPHPAWANLREAQARLVEAGKCRTQDRMLSHIERAEEHLDVAEASLRESPHEPQEARA